VTPPAETAIGAAMVIVFKSEPWANTVTPSGRAHGVESEKRLAADAVEVESSARNVPLSPAAFASAWHLASAPASPPEGVQKASDTKAMRVWGLAGATATLRNAWRQYRRSVVSGTDPQLTRGADCHSHTPEKGKPADESPLVVVQSLQVCPL
jgi:hypothetical protein